MESEISGPRARARDPEFEISESEFDFSESEFEFSESGFGSELRFEFSELRSDSNFSDPPIELLTSGNSSLRARFLFRFWIQNFQTLVDLSVLVQNLKSCMLNINQLKYFVL